MKLDHLITPLYRKQQIALHELPKGYGGGGHKWAPAVAEMVRRYGVKSVLDYGCGQGTLKKALKPMHLKVAVREYDPAIKTKRALPHAADIVVCTDVLEHIEPDRLGVVIDHLFRLSRVALFAVIATRPSKKFLPDGRNAHLIIEPESWWRERVAHPLFRHVDAPSSPGEQPVREWVALLERAQ